jgi:hypothetical protein
VATFLGAARAHPVTIANLVTGFAFARAHARIVVVPVAKMRRVDPVNGNADRPFAFPADEFAAREKLAQILADLPLDDLAKALMVFRDLHGNRTVRVRSKGSGKAKIKNPRSKI